MREEVHGFDCLGAEDDFATYLKKQAPKAISAVADELSSEQSAPKGKKPDASKDKKLDKGSSGSSWFTRPVLGPVPGWGVLGIGAGVVTGLGFLIRALLK